MNSYDDDGFDAFSSGGGADGRVSCGLCGRKFNPDVLGRHEPICAKTSQKKRKQFNMTKQRVEGTELASFVGKAGGRGRGRPAQSQARSKQTSDIPAAPKSNWRQQHQDFINAIRSAKGVQEAIDQGKPLPPPPPPSINPDYIQCPHCTRRFNQKAVERHISFCKEQHERLPNKSRVDPKAAAKQNTRIQYQPPKLRSKNPPMNSSFSPSSGYGSSSNSGSGGYSSPTGGYGVAGRGYGGSGGGSGSGKPPASGSRGRGGRPSPGSSTYKDQESPSSGKALRTGRTAEGYTDARVLSAKQRSGMPRKFPSDNNIHARTASRGDLSPDDSFSRPGSGTMQNGADSGYFGSNGNIPRATSAAKFCHECGTRYPIGNARFCCECGVKRMAVS